ncbi:hypothetical protein [Mesonia maritima]|uniref:Uncharacterized protein n=1 Tax=Mesonia maritima TaxID=1793873 RepID=A0ABU1K4X1_9FLAO|nr:hypothetical protein [Mesonia maritima]MDR6300641.1 hypothetical protein [Mesonia maritima]
MFTDAEIDWLYREYLDNYEEHEDYYQLEEHTGKDLYRYIISYLSSTHPKWNTNSELGRCAASAVLNLLVNLSECEEKYSQSELEQEIEYEYESMKTFHQKCFIDECLEKISRIEEESKHVQGRDPIEINTDQFIEKAKKKVIYNFKEPFLAL